MDIRISSYVRHNKQHKCIIAKFTGVLNDNTLQTCAEEIQKLSAERSCKRLLLDIREAKIQKNVLEFYRLPKKLYDLGISKGWKRAILVPSEQARDIFETEYIGRGLKVQICSNERAAGELLGMFVE
jgi:hypothetical protein